MRPAYLSGDRIYLRAMLLSDREQAAAWFDSPFPINATRAEVFLREEHKHFWGNRRLHYAIVGAESDAIVGGATVRSHNYYRTAWLTFHMAPWLEEADSLRAEALRLVIPWLRDEWEMMAVTVPIAADEAATLAADEAATLAADEAATLAADEAATLAADEAATLAADEAATLAADEAATLAADEAATLAADEAATLAADEAATLAADEAATLAADEQLGLILGARLREHVARAGHRVDRLLYQALNPRWEVADA